MNSKKFYLILFLLLLNLVFIFKTNNSYAVSDPDNCGMCHDHPNIVRMDEKGILRDFYIEEDIFIARSVHGNVRCVDCHDYIMEGGEPKVPHQSAITEKVRCNLICHSIIEPSRADDPTGKKYFSHENVYLAYKESAHGVADREIPAGEKVKNADDAPYCVYCHDKNPVYEKVGETLPLVDEPQLKRCRGCHKDDYAARFYRHTKHRFDMKTYRTKYQQVELCVECHGDKEMMGRHQLSVEPVETYEKTFHYKMVYHGGERWAGCVDCHTSINFPMNPNRPTGGMAGVHELLGKKNPKSAVYLTEGSRLNKEKDNLVKTCSVDVCHPKAGQSKSFARSVGHIEAKNFLGLHILEETFFWLCYGVLSFVIAMITLDLFRRIRG